MRFCLLIAAFFTGSRVCCGASRAEFIPISSISENLDFFTTAYGVSNGGTSVVGQTGSNDDVSAFLWMDDTGVQLLPEGLSKPTAAFAISDDGATIVGGARQKLGPDAQPFRWESEAALALLKFQTPRDSKGVGYGVSENGRTITGTLFGDFIEGFRWTEDSGLVGLGFLPELRFSSAVAISSDGSTIVGSAFSGSETEAFRWTELSGMVGLGGLSDADYDSEAIDVSADGSVIVGIADFEDGEQAFHWTQENGMVGLGFVPTSPVFSRPNAVSGNGEIIIGRYGENRNRSFIWDKVNDMQDLETFLIENFELGEALAGWQLNDANDISADGTSIVGSGINPDGRQQSWLVRFDSPLNVPEPSCVSLFLVCLSLLYINRPRREDKRMSVV